MAVAALAVVVLAAAVSVVVAVDLAEAEPREAGNVNQ
jgi:hypothetical protein